MSLLSRKIAAEVDSNPGPGVIEADDGSVRFRIDLIAGTAVGLAFQGLEFRATGPSDRPTDALKAWGDRLAARLTYLMEPIVVLEVDPVGGEVELRSQSPTERDSLRSYYEIILRREGSLRLRRVAFDSIDRRRREVPCQVTREALDRLVDDIAASAA